MKKENERKRRKLQDACDEDNRDIVKKKPRKENGTSHEETEEIFVGSYKDSKKVETPVLCNGKKRKKRVQENDCEKEHTSDGKEQSSKKGNEKAKKLKDEVVNREKRSKKKERNMEVDKDVNTVNGSEVVPDMSQNSFDKKNRKRKGTAGAEIAGESNEVTETPGVQKKKKRKRKRKIKIKGWRKKKKELKTYKSYAVHPALDYLRTWHSNREYWSFKKVRQSWLLQNLFDQEKIPDEDFSTLIKYLQGLKGSSREKTVKMAEQRMEENTDELDSVIDFRAQQVIQLLTD